MCGFFVVRECLNQTKWMIEGEVKYEYNQYDMASIISAININADVLFDLLKRVEELENRPRENGE